MTPISILIADDDATTRQCLRRAVESNPNLQIRWEADNGLQALLIAQKHHPEIVLMDTQIPRMDGIEVTRCLRRQNLPMRIVLMSVYDQTGPLALAAGADAFVTKDSGCEAIREAIIRIANQPPLTDLTDTIVVST